MPTAVITVVGAALLIVALSPIGVLGDFFRRTPADRALVAGVRGTTIRTLALTLAGTAIVALAALVALRWIYHPVGLAIEAAKSLLNVLTVAIAGQIVALLIADYQKTQERRAEADRFRHQTLATLTRAFMGAKGARRRARADFESASTDSDSVIRRARYFKCMDHINDIQLELEVLAKSMENRAELFGEGQATFTQVSAMEEYLNRLVDEWEKRPVPFSGQPPSCRVAALAMFNDFVGPYKSSHFRPEFVHNYYLAVDNIRSSLTLVRAATWKRRTRSNATAAGGEAS